MLNSLITSETRIRILKKFFLNCNTVSHLRGLESEFKESSNAIRLELNRFEKAGLLTSSKEGNKNLFRANDAHPLFEDIHNIVLKETGIDKVIGKIVNRIGNLSLVYLTGDFAKGKDGSIIDLILVGDDIDNDYLVRKMEQAGETVNREIKYVILGSGEADQFLNKIKPSDLLLLWEQEDGYKKA
jgi:DNA-binding transcriptional ArsR family regulator